MLSTLSRQSISKLSHLTANNGRNIQRTVSTFKNVSLRDVRRSATQKPKRDFNSLSGRRLDRMEDAANLDPHNAQKQADFLHELNKIDPNAVIQRFESNLFSSNEACLKEYISALAKVERLDKVMPQITSSIAKATPTGTSTLTPSAQKAFNQAAISSINMGTSNEPLHVVMQEPGIKAQMWKTLRTITLAFLLITGLSTLVEDKGLSRGMAVHNEVEPNSSNSNYKFADVQGVDEAKAELEEIVDYLKDPGKFTRLGGKLPKGVLLVGPPGTGKTLLARAIAGEAGVPFFYASGSEFDEMFVGVGARRIRELFAAAKRKAPCIIFIDEIDAIGGSRNPKDQQFVRMTLNQLLVELDGFNQTEGVIVIAATNFPESLDKALTRPGRFDRNVVVPLPDVRGREQILKVHARSVPLSKDADLQVIARGTPGFSGADLQNLINQGALRASLEGKAEVSMNHLEYARDKIIMGAERKSAVIEQENRKIVAFHEGGHALVALYTPGALPIHKATIMPRGQALGMVAQLPEKDELSWTKKQLYARLDVAMGGRAAEEMIFGTENVTSGASSDIEQATRIATAIVTKFGMSQKVGPVLHKEEDMSHLSPETRFLIESEIKTILEDAKQRAETILKTHKDELHRLANALLDYETLTKDEIEKVVTGKTFDREKVKKSQPVTTTKQDTPAAPLLLSESDKK